MQNEIEKKETRVRTMRKEGKKGREKAEEDKTKLKAYKEKEMNAPYLKFQTIAPSILVVSR